MAPTATPMLAGSATARARLALVGDAAALDRVEIDALEPRAAPAPGEQRPSRTCSTAMRSAAHGVRLAVRDCSR